MFQIVAEGRVLISYGPVELSIIAEIDGHGTTELALLGTEVIPKILKDLAPYQQLIKQYYPEIDLTEDYPEIVKRMYQSVATIGDPTVTPMAAVAGSIAGLVADEIFYRGASKVIVNNGGDIAIRLKPGEMTKVGLAPSIKFQIPSHYITVTADSQITGIASSGFGGRSFTKGIASVATVISSNVGIADAAATLVGNHTFVQDNKVKQVLAEDIYPETDLRGEKVTVKVEELSVEAKKLAIKRGLNKAKTLYDRGLIKGTVVFVQGLYGMVPQNIAERVQNICTLPRGKGL